MNPVDISFRFLFWFGLGLSQSVGWLYMSGVKQLLTRQFHTDAVSIGRQLVLLAHSCEANIQYPYGLYQLLISTMRNIWSLLVEVCRQQRRKPPLGWRIVILYMTYQGLWSLILIKIPNQCKGIIRFPEPHVYKKSSPWKIIVSLR